MKWGSLKLYGSISRKTERRTRAMSFGLMQVMGQVAHEYGCKAPYLMDTIALGLSITLPMANHSITYKFRLPESLLIRLKDYASKTGQSVSSVIRLAIDKLIGN